MTNNISHYLNSFKANLKIDLAVKDGVARELYTHFEDKSQDLRRDGISKEEADKIAIQALGPPELIARQAYETHARGSWEEALFSALPHLLFALLFASYLWQNFLCLSFILLATVGIAIYGWHRGKPVWLFPWLGYYLMPVIAAGMLLIYLPQGWGWIAALIYIPLALFAIIHIVTQTAKRDWLYASLMLAPMPVMFCWLLSLGMGSGFLTDDLWIAKLQTKVPWIVISFLVLAAATVSFIRIRPRWCKIISLFTPPIVILIAVTAVSRGVIGYWSWLILLLSLLAFAAPAWTQVKLRNS